MRVLSKTYCIGLLAGLLLVLHACGFDHPSEDLFEDYAGRIANVLELNANEIGKNISPDSIPTISLPRRNQRLQALTDFRISAWEYLQTYECSLNLLISERNSSLGKVMPETRRLVYETQLIVAVDRCVKQLAASEDSNQQLLEELRLIGAQKKTELKKALWNALFAGPEFEHFSSLSVPPFKPNEVEPLRIVNQSLDDLYILSLQVEKLQTGQEETGIEPEEIETPLHRLGTQQSLGRILQSVVLVIRELPTSTALLNSERAQNQLCPQQLPTTKARYIQNVFHSQFIAKIQPYLSMLDREGLRLVHGVERLTALHAPDNDNSVVSYLESIKRLFESSDVERNFRGVVKSHIEAWQKLFANCGLSPAR